MMTLEMFRNPAPGPTPGNAGANRRDSLALGSQFNPEQMNMAQLHMETAMRFPVSNMVEAGGRFAAYYRRHFGPLRHVDIVD